MAGTLRGVCAISLGDVPEPLVEALQVHFAYGRLIGANRAFERHVARGVGFVEVPFIGLKSAAGSPGRRVPAARLARPVRDYGRRSRKLKPQRNRPPHRRAECYAPGQRGSCCQQSGLGYQSCAATAACPATAGASSASGPGSKARPAPRRDLTTDCSTEPGPYSRFDGLSCCDPQGTPQRRRTGARFSGIRASARAGSESENSRTQYLDRSVPAAVAIGRQCRTARNKS